MSNWKTYLLAAVMATAAGFGYIKSSHRNIPADLRDAVADNTKPQDFDTSLPVLKKDGSDIPEPKAVAVKHVSKGYVARNDPSAGAPAKPVEWVTINGGTFTMGTDSEEEGSKDAKPIHEVVIKTFDMSKTDVTVEQYEECVLKGGCTEPVPGDNCNWGVAGRQFHPVNCVDWDQASKYAKFKGGRLPSEAEWEYAATGGKKQKYPWGNDEPDCDKAVMFDSHGVLGCGNGGTMPVCSKPAGDTEQGLCDMAGNVWQWVQDKYQDSYKGAPIDGSAFEAAGSNRVLRGGAFYNSHVRTLRADYRNSRVPAHRYGGIGFRLARSIGSDVDAARRHRVFVNGEEVNLIPGMTVYHALISAGFQDTMKGKKVYDEFGNEVGLSGELNDGTKLFVR